MEFTERENYFTIYMRKKAKSLEKRKKQIQSSSQHKNSSSITNHPNKMNRSINIKPSVYIQRDTNATIDMLQLKINNIISLIDNFKQEYITAFDNDIQSQIQHLKLNNTAFISQRKIINNSNISYSNIYSFEYSTHQKEHSKNNNNVTNNHKQRKSNSMMNNNNNRRNSANNNHSSKYRNDKINMKCNPLCSQGNKIKYVNNNSNKKKQTNNVNVISQKNVVRKNNKVHARNDANCFRKITPIKNKDVFATVDVNLKSTLTEKINMNNQYQTQKNIKSKRNRNDLRNSCGKGKHIQINNLTKILIHNSLDKALLTNHKYKSDRNENDKSYHKKFF
jgi:hypothetical protein